VWERAMPAKRRWPLPRSQQPAAAAAGWGEPRK